MLFRQQALKVRQSRLYGSVIISSPLAFWVTALFLIGILGGAVVFAALNSFARVEPVRGVVVPSGGIATVRAAASGILRGFELDEGDAILATQHLGQITAGGALAGEGSQLAAKLSRIEIQISNLRNQLEQTLVLAEIESVALIQQENRVEGRITRFDLLLELRRAAADETRVAFDRVLSLAERDFASEQQLSVERLQVITADQQVVELEGELAELSADLTEFARRSDEIKTRTELKALQIQIELNNLVAERVVLSANQSYAVTAPFDGLVSAVRARNGHEMRQGDPLFSLLPMNQVLQVELYVPSRAIAFVEPGLSVRLLLDALPYQQFGTASGEILEVTTIVMQPNSEEMLGQVDGPVFRATVALQSDAITNEGRVYPLQVGMTLTGNIILEERTILSRVIEPFVSVLRRY
jgi:membrane fusion protein